MKRTGMLLLGFVLAVTMMGCANTQMFGVTITQSPEPGSKTESLAGYMVIEGDTLYLDPVEIVTSEDSERIAELGLDIQNDLPSGYCVYNPDAETETFQLTEGTKYKFTDINLVYVKEADGKRIYETKEKQEFLDASSYQEVPMEEQKIPYFVDVSDGKVIRVTEEFMYTM